jgi:hypothetical protein
MCHTSGLAFLSYFELCNLGRNLASESAPIVPSSSLNTRMGVHFTLRARQIAAVDRPRTDPGA